MFTTFWDTILPFIGNICGYFTQLFSVPFRVTLNYLLYGDPLNYPNLFTGYWSTDLGHSIFEPVGVILDVIGSAFTSFIPSFYSLPTWCCFLFIALVFSALVWVLTSLIKLLFP